VGGRGGVLGLRVGLGVGGVGWGALRRLPKPTNRQSQSTNQQNRPNNHPTYNLRSPPCAPPRRGTPPRPARSPARRCPARRSCQTRRSQRAGRPAVCGGWGRAVRLGRSAALFCGEFSRGRQAAVAGFGGRVRPQGFQGRAAGPPTAGAARVPSTAGAAGERAHGQARPLTLFLTTLTFTRLPITSVPEVTLSLDLQMIRWERDGRGGVATGGEARRVGRRVADRTNHQGCAPDDAVGRLGQRLALGGAGAFRLASVLRLRPRRGSRRPETRPPLRPKSATPQQQNAAGCAPDVQADGGVELERLPAARGLGVAVQHAHLAAGRGRGREWALRAEGASNVQQKTTPARPSRTNVSHPPTYSPLEARVCARARPPCSEAG
jgi:hypothetical protein